MGLLLRDSLYEETTPFLLVVSSSVVPQIFNLVLMNIISTQVLMNIIITTYNWPRVRWSLEKAV